MIGEQELWSFFFGQGAQAHAGRHEARPESLEDQRKQVEEIEYAADGGAAQCAASQTTTIPGVLLARAIVLKLTTSDHGRQGVAAVQ
jgi:hypothetical protein